MTRLIFEKSESGDVYSTKQFLAREKVINGHVLVKDDGVHYLVTDLGSGKILASGIARNITLAKKAVKDRFKDLGVVLKDEVRKKLE